MITRFALFEGKVHDGKPDIATMEAALATPVRAQSKQVTGEIVDAYFDGKIHHHVTELNTFNE